MNKYYRFEWEFSEIDYFKVLDTQYYDDNGNYSIDYEVETRGELPLSVRMSPPFDVEGYPLVYNVMTSMKMVNYNDRNEYLRDIVFNYAYFLKTFLNVKIMLPMEKNKNLDIDDIEGYI